MKIVKYIPKTGDKITIECIEVRLALAPLNFWVSKHRNDTGAPLNKGQRVDMAKWIWRDSNLNKRDILVVSIYTLEYNDHSVTII